MFEVGASFRIHLHPHGDDSRQCFVRRRSPSRLRLQRTVPPVPYVTTRSRPPARQPRRLPSRQSVLARCSSPCVERLSIVNQHRVERPSSLCQPNGLRSARRGCIGLGPTSPRCDLFYLTVCQRFSCIYTKFDGSNQSSQRIDYVRPVHMSSVLARPRQRASSLVISQHVVRAVDRCRRVNRPARAGGVDIVGLTDSSPIS